MNDKLNSLFKRIGWQRTSAREIHFKNADSETNTLLGYTILYVLIGYLTGLLILNYPIPFLGATQFNQDVWYTFLFKIFFLLIVPCWIYFGKWEYSLKSLLFGLELSFKSVLWFILFFVIGFFVNAAHLKKIEEVLPNLSDANFRLAMGITMPLLTAAIPEEFVFRALLQTHLEKSAGRLYAILCATLLFTAWHLPSRYLLSKGVEGQAGDFWSVALHTGVPVFLVGLFFALHWDRYRNILVLVALHWGIDTLPSVSSYFRIPF